MTDAPFVFLVVVEDGTSHEHHVRLRRGDVTAVLRRAVGGRPALIPTCRRDLALWCDEDAAATPVRPNPVAGLLAAGLGVDRTLLVGPVAVTGRRGDRPLSLTAAQIDAVLSALAPLR
ncbi:hypothetical protein C1A38_05430 [Verrucosispora sp. ts21]|uniref:DUF3846 domain-containing protein n=1 Tax=Verrucosispora sp. ts21 TaxID=2069341 RepID=UPI000C880FC6|nr:hypothetical protein [Verrucosispora sp. ts21]PMR62175.1 hypothetical protein C1A38_05430 [Verrucosispora sp. ts21]